MLWCMDSLSCDFDFVDDLLIRCSKDDSSKISSGVKHLWSNDIVKPKCIPDEIIRSKFLLRDLYKTAFHCGTDRHVAPCILCNNQVLPNRIGDAFKLLLIFRQREEKTFLLFDADEKFLHRLFAQRPLPHIIVKSYYSRIFVAQNLIKTHGTKQSACFHEVRHSQKLKIFHILYFPVRSHQIWPLDYRRKRKLVLAAVAHNIERTILHISRIQTICIVSERNLHRISLKSILCQMNTKRRGINNSSYQRFLFTFNRKTSLVGLPFSDQEHQIRLRKLHFWLLLAKISI